MGDKNKCGQVQKYFYFANLAIEWLPNILVVNVNVNLKNKIHIGKNLKQQFCVHNVF